MLVYGLVVTKLQITKKTKRPEPPVSPRIAFFLRFTAACIVCKNDASVFIHEKAVRPSVKREDCDKTKETYAHILIAHERYYFLLTRRMVGGATPST